MITKHLRLKLALDLAAIAQAEGISIEEVKRRAGFDPMRYVKNWINNRDFGVTKNKEKPAARRGRRWAIASCGRGKKR